MTETDLEASLGKALKRTKTQKTKKSVKQGKVASPPVKRGRGGHLKQANPHTKRVTLDLTPEQNRSLAVFAASNGTKKNPTLRAFIELLEVDETLQKQILTHIERNK